MNSLEQSSPARLFATLAGGFLVILGIVGFFYNASFDTNRGLRANEVFGVLAVNGWDNLFHIATGLLGLACAGYAARQYSLGVGLLYVIIAIWGFAESHNGHGALLDLLPFNTAGNFLHLIVGLAGLGAGAATVEAGRSRPARESKSEATKADASGAKVKPKGTRKTTGAKKPSGAGAKPAAGATTKRKSTSPKSSASSRKKPRSSSPSKRTET